MVISIYLLMADYLVIVESPAKAKTIERYLGKKYKVKASIGHVRDLPRSQTGIDTENNYQPKYITIRGKGPVLQELKQRPAEERVNQRIDKFNKMGFWEEINTEEKQD